MGQVVVLPRLRGALLARADHRRQTQLLTPNGPNTAGDDPRKRALEFYAKAKAIRHPPQQARAKRLAPQLTGFPLATSRGFQKDAGGGGRGIECASENKDAAPAVFAF
jgi:hypothetical protein